MVMCERVSEIFLDAVKKIKFVANSPVDVLQFREDLATSDEATLKLCQRVNELEKRCENLQGDRINLKSFSNKCKYKEAQLEMQKVNFSLRECNKELIRSLKELPSVSANMLKIHRDLNDLVELLLSSLDDYRRGSLGTLTNHININNIDKAAKSALADKKKLLGEMNQKLKHDECCHTQSISESLNEINEIQRNLLEIQNGAPEVHKIVKAKTESLFQSFRQKEISLESEISTLEKAIEEEKCAHNINVQHMKKKLEDKKKRENEKEQEYHRQFEKVEESYEKLSHERGSQLEELLLLENRRDCDLELERIHTETAQIEREKSHEENEQKKKEIIASIVLQRRCKSFLKARIIQKQKKKKTSTKGKKKKKSKK